MSGSLAPYKPKEVPICSQGGYKTLQCDIMLGLGLGLVEPVGFSVGALFKKL